VTARETEADIRPCSPSAAPGRLLRASVFAGSSVCLATAAHVAGGGTRPALLALLCAWALLTRIGFGASRRETPTARLVGAAVGAQLALHTTFCLLVSHPSTRPAPGATPLLAAMGGMGGMGGMGAAGGAGGTAGAAGLAGLAGPDPSGMGAMAPMATSYVPGVRMIAAHLLATLAVAVLLRRAERVWFGATAGWLAGRRHTAAIGDRARNRRALAGLTRLSLATWLARLEATARAGRHDVARDPRRWPKPPWRELPSIGPRRRGPPAPVPVRISFFAFTTSSALTG
jgi:hypothetical protein